jgi:hypothetical protein
MAWMPGETKSLPFFVPHGELGLSLVSDEPAPRRPAHDWTVRLDPDDPAVLELPYFEVFELSMYVTAGSAYVYIGESELPIWVNERESHFGVYSYTRCPKLKFLSGGAALLHVKQEERSVKNTLGRSNRV